MNTSNFSKWLTICLFLITTIVFGCKKTETGSERKTLKSDKTIKEIAFSGMLDYSNAVTQASADESIQRMLIPIVTKNKNLYKYYFLENNQVTKNSSSTYIISKEPITKTTDLFTVPITKDGVTAYDNSRTGKTKAVLRSKLILKHDGKELNINAKFSELGIGEVVNTNTYEPNYAPNEGGGYCIDHWWVTYDTETGETLSIDYIGEDCYGCMLTGTCETGGGGGGGSEQPPSCTQLLENFANQGNAVSVKIGVADIYNTGTEWKQQYMWQIFQAGPWGVTSTEEGTLEKKPYKTNMGQTFQRWEFMSFVHKNTNAIGINLGGTREVKDVTGTPNITPTRLTANMDLTYTILSKILGLPGACSSEQTYTVSCSWAAPNNNVVIVAQ